uniref:Gag-pol polyprotein n=1 Tax=Solanum tuberosum TaxID=4113 RepID=M1D8Q5_SOLTU
MVDFVVILGMDWLHSCYTLVDCRTRIVRFELPDKPILEWKGSSLAPRGRFISYLKTRKMISKGYLYHLVRVKDSSSKTPALESILVMGQLAHSVDRRATRLKASIPHMIQTALTDVVTPLSATIDSLVDGIVMCERSHGAIEEVMALKAAIVALRRDVDQLKSIDMSMIFGTVDIPDVPVKPDMPPTTTEYDVRVEEAADPKSKAEMDEEMLGVVEDVSYEGLTETEEAMVDVAVQASLADTPLVDPSGASTINVTLGTDAEDQSTTPGTDAQTDGGTV